MHSPFREDLNDSFIFLSTALSGLATAVDMFGSAHSMVDITGRGIAPRAGLPLGLRLFGRGRVERLMTRRRYRKWRQRPAEDHSDRWSLG